MKRTPMTVRGAEALRAELKRLKSRGPAQVIKAIAEARAHGDLSENAEYHAAREQQGFIEGRIQEIEAKLSTAEIIDPSTLPKNGRWCSAPWWIWRTRRAARAPSYQIVGEDEADLKAGRISVTSPIARALVAKSEGRYRGCGGPGGAKSYEIVAVKALSAQALRIGDDQAGLGVLARYSTATWPIRWTSVLSVRVASRRTGHPGAAGRYRGRVP